MEVIIMKKVLVGMLIGLGLVGLGVAIGFTKEAKSNGVQAVQCGYVYDEYIPEHMPTWYMEDFEEHIWNMYISEYCVNYCGTCDSYSYEHCLCCECTDDSECSELDYQLFIEDNMSMIIDEYYEWLSWIQEDYREMNYVVYEF
jgi:hypothetical protein